MPGVAQDFSLLPVADIQSLLADWRAALKAIAQGQEYHIGNRSLRRADIKEASQMVADLTRSLAVASGQLTRNARARFVSPYNCANGNLTYLGPT